MLKANFCFDAFLQIQFSILSQKCELKNKKRKSVDCAVLHSLLYARIFTFCFDEIIFYFLEKKTFMRSANCELRTLIKVVSKAFYYDNDYELNCYIITKHFNIIFR